MPTEITQEMVNALRNILVIKQVTGEDGHSTSVTVFADDVDQNVIDRIQTYDMIKDEFTRETMHEFLNHFARLLELDLGTYTIKDLNAVFHSIYDVETAYGGDVDYLTKWLADDPYTREDYFNDALETLIDMDDPDRLNMREIIQEAKLIETLEVFDLGYNFIKWYLDIEEDGEE
jgi:hypothetical protein